MVSIWNTLICNWVVGQHEKWSEIIFTSAIDHLFKAFTEIWNWGYQPLYFPFRRQYCANYLRKIIIFSTGTSWSSFIGFKVIQRYSSRWSKSSSLEWIDNSGKFFLAAWMLSYWNVLSAFLSKIMNLSKVFYESQQVK